MMTTVNVTMSDSTYVNNVQTAIHYLNIIKSKGNVAYTHDGLYHADDVFSATLLTLMGDGHNRIEIKRSREFKWGEQFTFDVGGGPFDHHQGNEYRDNDAQLGIYAAFGKLWNVFGPYFINCYCTGLSIKSKIKIWKSIDMKLVQWIDHTDNTGEMNPLNYVINSVRSTRLSYSDGDVAFNMAVKSAEEYLYTIIFSELELAKGYEKCYRAFKSEDQIGVVMDYAPLDREWFNASNHCWIASPNPDGTITVQFNPNKLPKEYWGVANKGDIIFIHKGGWTGKVKSLSILNEIFG